MKIECPNCKLTGQTSDLNIPPEGRYMDCPRCKANFFVQKTAVANWADTMADCPQCGYSSYSAERFDICPQCGLVAKTYNEQHKKQPPPRKAVVRADEPVVIDPARMRQELERLEREEQKRRLQRAENLAVPLPVEEPEPEVLVVPAPVKYLGWGFTLAGLLVLGYGMKGGYDYWKITPEQAVTTPYEDIPGPFMLYLTHGLSPTVQVLLGIYAVVAAFQFMKMRPGARMRLEMTAWSGVAYVVVSDIVSLIISISRSSGDVSFDSFLYYIVAFAGFILMAALWSAPLLTAIWYMRRDVITDEFDE